MPFIRAPMVAAALALCTCAVQADEVWESEFGDVVHERDAGSWAVWSFAPASGAGSGKIFIDGLGGVYSGRGSYGGYWMFYDSPDQPCPEVRSDLEGNASRNYGAFEITFLDPDFPSRWSATWGACDGPATTPWNGTPKTGDASSAGTATGGGWLGVRLQTVTAELAASLGMTRAVGVVVTDVTPGSPAAANGIAAGDVIWRADGTEVAGSRELASQLQALPPGSPVELDIIKQGAAVTVEVALGERPGETTASPAPSSPPPLSGSGEAGGETEIAALGNLAAMRVTYITRAAFGIGEDVTGLVVTAAQGNAFRTSPPGTVILEAGGGAVAAVANLRSAIESQAAANAPLLVRLLRHGERNTLFAAIDPDELSGASGSLLTTAGLGYDRGDNGVFSTELAATHLLAAVAAGDDAALDLLTNRSGTLNLTTREIIQRRLVDSGHYRGTVDGVFGPATGRAIVDYRTSSGG